MSRMDQMSRLRDNLTTSEAARELGVSRSTIRRAIHEGQIRGFRLRSAWRIPRAEVTRIRAGDPLEEPST